MVTCIGKADVHARFRTIRSCSHGFFVLFRGSPEPKTSDCALAAFLLTKSKLLARYQHPVLSNNMNVSFLLGLALFLLNNVHLCTSQGPDTLKNARHEFDMEANIEAALGTTTVRSHRQLNTRAKEYSVTSHQSADGKSTTYQFQSSSSSSSNLDEVKSRGFRICLGVLCVGMLAFVLVACVNSRRQPQIEPQENSAEETTMEGRGNNNDKDQRLMSTSIHRRALSLIFQKRRRSSVMKEKQTTTIDNEDTSVQEEELMEEGALTENCKTNNPECCICLEPFLKEDALVMTGLCNHVCHRDCVMGWVQKKNSCPLCREPLFDEKSFDALKQKVLQDRLQDPVQASTQDGDE